MQIEWKILEPNRSLVSSQGKEKSDLSEKNISDAK